MYKCTRKFFFGRPKIFCMSFPHFMRRKNKPETVLTFLGYNKDRKKKKNFETKIGYNKST